MLMALGQFVFKLSTLAYNELQRSTAWRHAASSRVGAREALQFVGPGEDTINLRGTLVPEIAGTFQSLATLRAMADAGSAYAMVDGAGRVMGAWVILEVIEQATAFTQDGIARRTEFGIQLRHADDEKVEPGQPDIATIDNGQRGGTLA